MNKTQPFTELQQVVPIANRTAIQIVKNSNQLFQQLVSQYQQAYNNVWNNPGATPDTIVAALGTNAQKIFMASAGLAAYLNSLGAGVVATMPSGWNYVANTDGSVTLTVAAPAPAK